MNIETLLGVLGQPGTYHSPVHFTAAYASATTLTLAGTGIPTITDDTQILGVLEARDGESRYYVYPARDYLTSYSAPTLTVEGGDFQSTSLFVVIITGPTNIEAESAPATGIGDGTAVIAAAATPLVGAPTPCIEVTVQNQTSNSGMRVGGSGITATTGVVLPGGGSMTISIDDVAKVHCWALAAGESVDFTYLTR